MVHVARRLRRVIRQGIFEVTADQCFDEVIEQCAATPRPEQGGTWILPEMISAYKRLHALGYAHSIECWRSEVLVGGLYGVGIGGCFFAESMYSHVDNASKIALTALARQCQRWGIVVIDCQMNTAHLARMGAQTAPRETFLKLVENAVLLTCHSGRWRLDEDILADV
mgnify:CR=1 FL=1